VDKMIEVRYAGVVIGRTAIIRELDTRGLFLGITEPMPVGSPLSLRIGDQTIDQAVQGKVEVVSESQELAHAGMRVRFSDPRSATLFGTPSEAPPEPEPPAARARVEPVEKTADAASRETSSVSGAPAVRDAAGSNASAVPAAHRRIVVDASAEKVETGGVPESASGDEGDGSAANAADGERIPAPDALAFGPGGGGGRKGRRNKRR
jgi:hypothetical protein